MSCLLHELLLTYIHLGSMLDIQVFHLSSHGIRRSCLTISPSTCVMRNPGHLCFQYSCLLLQLLCLKQWSLSLQFKNTCLLSKPSSLISESSGFLRLHPCLSLLGVAYLHQDLCSLYLYITIRCGCWNFMQVISELHTVGMAVSAEANIWAFTYGCVLLLKVICFDIIGLRVGLDLLHRWSHLSEWMVVRTRVNLFVFKEGFKTHRLCVFGVGTPWVSIDVGQLLDVFRSSPFLLALLVACPATHNGSITLVLLLGPSLFVFMILRQSIQVFHEAHLTRPILRIVHHYKLLLTVVQHLCASTARLMHQEEFWRFPFPWSWMLRPQVFIYFPRFIFLLYSLSSFLCPCLSIVFIRVILLYHRRWILPRFDRLISSLWLSPCFRFGQWVLKRWTWFSLLDFFVLQDLYMFCILQHLFIFLLILKRIWSIFLRLNGLCFNILIDLVCHSSIHVVYDIFFIWAFLSSKSCDLTNKFAILVSFLSSTLLWWWNWFRL